MGWSQVWGFNSAGLCKSKNCLNMWIWLATGESKKWQLDPNTKHLDSLGCTAHLSDLSVILRHE